MLKILPEVEDVENIKKIREVVYEINESEEGDFYHIEYSGKIMYLHRKDEVFTLFSYEGEYLNCEQFTIDEDYRVNSISLSEHIVYLDKNGYNFLDENGNYLSLHFKEIEESEEDDLYNGFVSFSQYNNHTKETIVITYPYFFRKDCPKKLLSLESMEPMELLFKKFGILNKKYFCYEGECGTLFYALVAIKDYGLKEFLKNGSYSLEKSSYVKRFIRFFGNDEGFNFFPFCHAYREGDMYIMLKNKGFLTDIPKELLSFHNDFVENGIGDYCAIANAFKEKAKGKSKNILLNYVKKNKE